LETIRIKRNQTSEQRALQREELIKKNKEAKKIAQDKKKTEKAKINVAGGKKISKQAMKGAPKNVSAKSL
jgi:hypothetical protein